MKKIKLTKGYVAIVDNEDFEWLNQYPWHVNLARNTFPRAMGRMKGSDKVFMHRIILHAPANRDVDHINHNTLDNRRSNLRLATTTQNNGNSTKRQFTKGKQCSSRFKGVSWSKDRNKWKTEGNINNKYFFFRKVFNRRRSRSCL